MKNGSISEQLELQNQNFTGEKKKEVFQSSEKENNISCNLDNKEGNRHSNNQQHNSRGDSLLSIFSVGEDNNNDSIPVEELQAQKRKKKKKRGIRR